MDNANRTRQHAMAAALFLILILPTGVQAQFGRGAAPPPVQGRDGALFDLTGYWTALITDDWQYRMITPVAGDYSYIPLNDEGRSVADEWNSAADEAAGEECKAYAAPAIMRLPTRLRVAWENDDTLRIDTDLGMQTRMFHFDGAGASPGEPTWQGFSRASWEIDGAQGGLVFGSLKVDTDNLRPGYLRKNGVPFSEDTFMTEYFNLLTEDNGDQYLVIQTFVYDPRYLSDHFVRTLQFKREPDGERWNPTPCTAT